MFYQNISKYLTALLIAVPLLFLIQCNGAEDSSAAFEDERQELMADLRDIQDDLNDRMDEMATRIDRAGDEVDEDLENAYRELTGDRNAIERAIAEVESSTESTWEVISSGTRDFMDDVSSRWDEWTDDAEESLEEMEY